jgi:serine/threonine protein kinase/Tfp pilus assembly protein PilF
MATPNIIAHYRIVRKLGAGGMGEVFLATDTKLERDVAIKVLPHSVASDDRHRSRFIREARTAASLSHPNICSIYAVEEWEGTICIVMEYVQGQTLADLAHAGHPSFDLVYLLAEQCCNGLTAAASKNIVHRDIKPSNIMIDTTGRVRIMDFGLAKQVLGDSQTQTGVPLGTYHYMSPEQITGQAVDCRSDLFSLGVVLYEVTSGRLPWSGDNIAAIAYSIVHEQPRPLSLCRPDMPADLERIINRSLEKDLAHRYQHASEMLFDIRARQATAPVSPISSSGPQSSPSIAVYPFRNLSPEPEIDYIADGLCEDVITRLSRIKSLKVASRTAVFRFRGEKIDPSDMAAKLGVAVYLEGSIRKYGNDLRITVQLTRAASGFMMWSDHFDRHPGDILRLQAELAERICEALQIKLTDEEGQVVAGVRTVAYEAYDHYLRGKFHLKRRNAASTEKAIELFTKAVEIDPAFTSAYAELSLAYNLCLLYGFRRSHDCSRRAFELASKALSLDPESSDAHMAMGMSLRNSDFQKAIQCFQRALQLDPGNVEGYHYLAHTYVLCGRYEDAAARDEKAIRLDPFYAISRAELVRIYYWLGRRNDVLEQLRTLREDDFTPHLALANEGWIEWSNRNWEAAAMLFEKALQADPNNSYCLDYLADCYRRVGRLEEAVQLVEDLYRRDPEKYDTIARLAQLHAGLAHHDKAQALFSQARSYLDAESENWLNSRSSIYYLNLAYINALQEDNESAIDALESAVKAGLGHYRDLETRPDWDGLRSSPRFSHLLFRISSQRGL